MNHGFGNGNGFEGTVSRDPEEIKFTGLGGQRGRRRTRREQIQKDW